jgi:hypothetical protein
VKLCFIVNFGEVGEAITRGRPTRGGVLARPADKGLMVITFRVYLPNRAMGCVGHNIHRHTDVGDLLSVRGDLGIVGVLKPKDISRLKNG